MVYLSDNRWWLGGLKSGHAHVHAVDPELKDFHVRIEAELFEQIPPPQSRRPDQADVLTLHTPKCRVKPLTHSTWVDTQMLWKRGSLIFWWATMTRLCLFVFALFFSLLQPAFAGGAPAPQSTFNWEESTIPDLATRFAMSVGDDQFDIAYNGAGDVLRDLRS